MERQREEGDGDERRTWCTRRNRYAAGLYAIYAAYAVILTSTCTLPMIFFVRNRCNDAMVLRYGEYIVCRSNLHTGKAVVRFSTSENVAAYEVLTLPAPAPDVVVHRHYHQNKTVEPYGHWALPLSALPGSNATLTLWTRTGWRSTLADVAVVDEHNFELFRHATAFQALTRVTRTRHTTVQMTWGCPDDDNTSTNSNNNDGNSGICGGGNGNGNVAGNGKGEEGYDAAEEQRRMPQTLWVLVGNPSGHWVGVTVEVTAAFVQYAGESLAHHLGACANQTRCTFPESPMSTYIIATGHSRHYGNSAHTDGDELLDDHFPTVAIGYQFLHRSKMAFVWFLVVLTGTTLAAHIGIAAALRRRPLHRYTQHAAPHMRERSQEQLRPSPVRVGGRAADTALCRSRASTASTCDTSSTPAPELADEVNFLYSP